MDILMITHFCVLPWEKGNGRFAYIANELAALGHDVENVTSSFSHDAKQQRSMRDAEAHCAELPYKITLISEPDYKKNVSLKRLSSHKKFAKNLSSYLKERAKPDVVYCAVPSLDVAKTAADYCKNNGVRFVIDVQDLWPEAFKMVFNVPVLGNIMFSPMERKANKAYSAADAVIAVSETYAARALRVNKKSKTASVVYLGTDKAYFDECASAHAPVTEESVVNRIVAQLGGNADGDKKIRLVYIGTLGNSYDLPTVFDALKRLDKSVLDNLEVIVMGDGPKRGEFEVAAAGLPVVFTGNLSYPDMVWILTRCDIALNPIVKGSAGSVINKHMDYAMAGLPVINTQESAEYRALLDRFACGVNCRCQNSDDVAKAICELVTNREKAAELGRNSRRMGEDLFDRKTAYKKIVDVICGDAEEKK